MLGQRTSHIRSSPIWPKTALHGTCVGFALLCSGLSFTFCASPSLGAPEARVAAHWLKENPNATTTLSHGMWTSLLRDYVKPHSNAVNLVDYRGLKRSGRPRLKKYMLVLQGLQPTTYRRAEQLPYWLNLYNATVMDIVTRHYPVSSIRDIGKGLFGGGPWKEKILHVEGKALSLDEIEHRILRPIWKGPRVHYGLNSASLGAPNVLRQAFTISNVDALLDANATNFINHSRGVQLRGGKLRVSSLYHWYLKDFGGNTSRLVQHLRQYAKGPLKRALEGYRTGYTHAFSWKLNQQ